MIALERVLKNIMKNLHLRAMRKIFVTGNPRLVRGYSGVGAFIGAIILGGLVYQFAFSELSNDWYITLILGVIALLSGFPQAVGWSKPELPEIHLDGEKMEWKRTAWNTSFYWNKLERVEFNGRKLRVTYAMTGSSDILEIPILTDTETINALKKSICEACELHKIAFFDSQINIERQ